MQRARRLGFHDVGALDAFLRTDPTQFALPLGWLHAHGVAPAHVEDRFEFLGIFEQNELRGAALLIGRALCFLAASSSSDGLAVAEHLVQSAQTPRAVTGPPKAVAALCAEMQRRGFPVLVEHAQQVMVLRPKTLRYFAAPLLTVGSEHDLDDVGHASIAMQGEETGVQAGRREIDAIRRATAARIENGRTWIWRESYTNALCFKASIAVVAADVAQLEGVWVPPSFRGQGIGRRGVSELCRRILTTTGAMTLYVSRSNEPAVRMYERVGFAEHGRWATAYFLLD